MPPKEVKISGVWDLTVQTPQADFVLMSSGKIDGEKMAADVQMGDFGTSSWSAKKKK